MNAEPPFEPSKCWREYSGTPSYVAVNAHQFGLGVPKAVHVRWCERRPLMFTLLNVIESGRPRRLYIFTSFGSESPAGRASTPALVAPKNCRAEVVVFNPFQGMLHGLERPTISEATSSTRRFFVPCTWVLTRFVPWF